MTETVLIIDFGSQVTQLIARRVRESGVYSEIVPFTAAVDAIHRMKPRAIILSGGPASTHEAGTPRAPAEVFSVGVPLLGICYGQQTMVAQLGGEVSGSDHREFGRAQITLAQRSPLFEGLGDPGSQLQVWMSHGDRVDSLPGGFDVIASSPGAPFAAIADESRGLYGVQFHPEVMHTPQGAAMLRNFTHEVAGCKGGWTMARFGSGIRRSRGSASRSGTGAWCAGCRAAWTLPLRRF